MWRRVRRRSQPRQRRNRTTRRGRSRRSGSRGRTGRTGGRIGPLTLPLPTVTGRVLRVPGGRRVVDGELTGRLDGGLRVGLVIAGCSPAPADPVPIAAHSSSWCGRAPSCRAGATLACHSKLSEVVRSTGSPPETPTPAHGFCRRARHQPNHREPRPGSPRPRPKARPWRHGRLENTADVACSRDFHGTSTDKSGGLRLVPPLLSLHPPTLVRMMTRSVITRFHRVTARLA